MNESSKHKKHQKGLRNPYYSIMKLHPPFHGLFAAERARVPIIIRTYLLPTYLVSILYIFWNINNTHIS